MSSMRLEITQTQLRDALYMLFDVDVAPEDLRVGLPAGGGYDQDVVLVVYVEPRTPASPNV